MTEPRPPLFPLVRPGDGGALLAVRVAPRASRAQVLGRHGDALKVALTAPPVDGAANAALIQLLSKQLGVARRTLSIVKGARSRDKLVRVAAVEPEQLSARLQQLLADQGGA